MRLNKEELLKIDKCSPLLPDPGPKVVERLLGHIYAVENTTHEQLAANDAEIARLTTALRRATTICCEDCGERIEGEVPVVRHVKCMPDEAAHQRQLDAVRAEVYDLRARGANSDPSINFLYHGWADRLESALAAVQGKPKEKP